MKKLAIILIIALSSCQASNIPCQTTEPEIKADTSKVDQPSVSYHEAMQHNIPKATKAEKIALKIFMVSLAVIVLASIK